MIRGVVRYFSNRSLQAESRRAQAELASINDVIEEQERLLYEENTRLNEDFDQRISALTDILAGDRTFYEALYPHLRKYLVVYFRRENLLMEKRIISMCLKQLSQRRTELRDWVSSISEDITQLEEVKIELHTDWGMDANLALASDQNADFPKLNGERRDLVILRRYREAYKDSPEVYAAVGNLITLFNDKAELRNEIDYVNWAIQQLIGIRHGLIGGMRETQAKARPLRERIRQLNVAIDEAKKAVVLAGGRIHSLWNAPIEAIDEELKAVDERLRAARQEIEYYKGKVRQCHDWQEYDDLDRYKAKRDAAVQENQSLWTAKNELWDTKKVWLGRRKMVLDNFRRQRIYLERGRRAQ